jgi:two-component system chemotaxis response regulator CheB
MVKVLVVDDSAFMRNALTSMLTSDREIQVIGTARNGIEAIAKVKTLRPDIVTLDIEMPRMDGIEALKHIMAENPVPVVMVSSLTEEGAKVTLEALELGALDFIPKNLSDLSVNILKIKEMLVDKIKVLSRTSKFKLMRKSVRPTTAIKPASQQRAEETPTLEVPRVDRAIGERRMGILAIGTSTGGPKALQEILPSLPAKFPVPVVIAQHMPHNFTGPFAERLDSLSEISVKEAVEGEILLPGYAYIAPGGHNMRIERTGGLEIRITISENKEDYIYCPSVDALFLSVNETFPGRTLALMLTGMGHDGIDGVKALKNTGSRVFAQNEETCVVYGMPKAVVDSHLADKVLPLERIAGEVVNSV